MGGYILKPGVTGNISSGGEYNNLDVVDSVNYSNLAAESAAAAAASATSAAADANSASADAASAADSASTAANASRLTPGTTTTGAPGTSAVVTITGPVGAQLLNLTIPRGADGSAGGGDMYKADNLSGLANYTTARNNLGLGSAATTSSTAYATAAQGTKADSALQASAIGVSVQAYDPDLTAWSAIAPSSKQDTLVSSTNIKTINSTSLLGAGDITTGTVTSITAGAGLSGNTITGSGTIGLAASYGDTVNPYASKAANYILAAPNGSAGVPTFRAVTAADIPTLNQNTTGTAANITATSNSTITTLSSLSLPYSQLSGTIPTWNQSTTGTAANVTGIVAVANGGTGTSTPGLVQGTNVTITGTWPNQTINATGGGGGGDMFKADNLSGLANYTTARSNLGLGTAATTNSTAYATAAQGTKADSALQASNIGVTVQGYSSNLASWSALATSAKQDSLVSGSNIKTINGNTILGAGNIVSSALRAVVYSTATSITINADTTDIATMANTQSPGTFTVNAPTGTLADGQRLMLRLSSTNTQTFSWSSAFAGSTDLSLPVVSTGSGKYDYMGFIYNSTTATWQIVAKNFGF